MAGYLWENGKGIIALPCIVRYHQENYKVIALSSAECNGWENGQAIDLPQRASYGQEKRKGVYGLTFGGELWLENGKGIALPWAASYECENGKGIAFSSVASQADETDKGMVTALSVASYGDEHGKGLSLVAFRNVSQWRSLARAWTDTL